MNNDNKVFVGTWLEKEELDELRALAETHEISVSEAIRQLVRLAPTIQFAVSRHRGTRRFEFEGQRYTVKQLAEKVGLKHGTLRTRLQKGWPVEHAVKPLYGWSLRPEMTESGER